MTRLQHTLPMDRHRSSNFVMAIHNIVEETVLHMMQEGPGTEMEQVEIMANAIRSRVDRCILTVHAMEPQEVAGHQDTFNQVIRALLQGTLSMESNERDDVEHSHDVRLNDDHRRRRGGPWDDRAALVRIPASDLHLMHLSAPMEADEADIDMVTFWTQRNRLQDRHDREDFLMHRLRHQFPMVTHRTTQFVLWILQVVEDTAARVLDECTGTPMEREECIIGAVTHRTNKAVHTIHELDPPEIRQLQLRI